MKNLILLFALVISVSELNAQDSTGWNISSISFSTGETPLTSGNTFTGVFSKGKSTIIVDYNATLGELIYFYSPIKQFSFGPSGGFVKNTPWVAPIAQLDLFKSHVKTLHWIGWSLGDPEKGGTSKEVLFCFSYQQVSLLHKGVELYYANNIYQKNTSEHIFGVKETFKLNKKFSTFFGGGYMMNAKKFLWSTGLNYNY